jgi:hypothetical protein
MSDMSDWTESQSLMGAWPQGTLPPVPVHSPAIAGDQQQLPMAITALAAFKLVHMECVASPDVPGIVLQWWR